MPGDHFYCLDSHGELAPQTGYEFEGITGYVYSVQQPETVAIHRWYNTRSGDHFYTADPSGELAHGGGYQPEGIGWYMYPTQKTGTVPLHRWYNARNGDHFYTTDPMGELAPSGGYTSEGITGYLYPYQAIDTSPLHRWFQSGMFSNFIFDTRVITEAQKNRLLERHAFAYYRSGICNNLQPQERDKVRDVYRRAINHGINTDPNANASAIVGGSNLWINFDNLFPLGDREITQTLLHEMMHCAGYTHGARTVNDRPGDGGVYYNSPPLRAEMCIEGIQSDASINALNTLVSVGSRDCPVINN